MRPISHKWYGCRRDLRDPRDKMMVSRAVRLPPSVDLREHCPPVMDQGDIGSCTAHGITGALRFLLRRTGQPDTVLSRLQLYYDERKLEGTVAEDAGAEIRNGIKCAAKLGVASEDLWPYEVSRFRDAPPPPVYTDAQRFNALTYERVPVGVNALKQALAQGFPVIIGVTLFDSFEADAVARTGVVPFPSLAHEEPVGGHCMYAVGYGQRGGYFTVRNSWGTDWGDKGDCYLPEAYLGSNRYGSDYWIIRGVG